MNDKCVRCFLEFQRLIETKKIKLLFLHEYRLITHVFGVFLGLPFFGFLFLIFLMVVQLNCSVIKGLIGK